MKFKIISLLFYLAWVSMTSYAPTAAAQTAGDLDSLWKEIDELRRMDQERQKRIDDLEKKVQELSGKPASAAAPAAPESELDQILSEVEVKKPVQAAAAPAQPVSPTRNMRLIDSSVSIVSSVGGSTEENTSLEQLQAGGHDPNKRGFTVNQVELFFTGVIDPYFTGGATITHLVDGVELEEGYLTTNSLPHGLNFTFGQLLTQFGRLNPVHVEAWDFMDQPVIMGRLFGPDGMRGPGAEVSWLTPLPWFSELHFGVQNADGRTMRSFLGSGLPSVEDESLTGPASLGIGGLPAAGREVNGLEDFAYLLRWDNSGDFNPDLAWKLGLSFLYGPNDTGPGGRTRIYGTDFTLKWVPALNDQGWPFVRWQLEFMYRDFSYHDISLADAETGGDLFIPQGSLRDYGMYSQVLYGFRRPFALGFRSEFAAGRRDGLVDGGRSRDPFRDNRYRFSPLVSWKPSEFSRLRLQYNYDVADHLDHPAHTLWLGFDVLFGVHPAHGF